MLDLAFEPNERSRRGLPGLWSCWGVAVTLRGADCRSRLGCQIVLSREKDGLAVSLPPGAHNLFDEFGGDRDM